LASIGAAKAAPFQNKDNNTIQSKAAPFQNKDNGLQCNNDGMINALKGKDAS
jgi:hypothetical protein